MKIGTLANKKEVMKEFHDTLWKCHYANEFEDRWRKWIIANNIEDNKWLRDIFELRHQWVPIFLLDFFCAGMKTIQRSESMNAFLRSRVTQYNTLFEFVTQYEDAMRSQREKENHSDNVER